MHFQCNSATLHSIHSILDSIYCCCLPACLTAMTWLSFVVIIFRYLKGVLFQRYYPRLQWWIESEDWRPWQTRDINNIYKLKVNERTCRQAGFFSFFNTVFSFFLFFSSISWNWCEEEEEAAGPPTSGDLFFFSTQLLF